MWDALYILAWCIGLAILFNGWPQLVVNKTKRDTKREQKLLEENNALKDRVSVLEEVVLFDGDKRELALSIKERKLQERNGEVEAVRLKELEVEKARIEARARETEVFWKS